MAKTKKGKGKGNRANAKTNAGNQTTANQPQTNNASNSNNPPNNNAKGKSTKWRPTISQIARLWKVGLPMFAELAFNRLNSTSPTQNKLLSHEPLWEDIKNGNDAAGLAANSIDALLSPTTSRIWDAGISAVSNKISNPTLKNVTESALTGVRYGLDYIPYFHSKTLPYKLARDVTVTGANNIWDIARDYNALNDYSYKKLGFDGSTHTVTGNTTVDDILWGVQSGMNNLFSIFGEDRDYYQRGRYSLNEMLSAMAKEIENSKDKSSPEYKDLVGKFEKFNNLAKLSDFYWTTKKEMDASDLSKEDFLKSKNIAPETFDYSEQNAHTVHNLGNNLSLNESSGNKRSNYVAGNHKYQDFTDAVNEAKKSLEGDNTDIDSDTLNAAMNMGTDVGKVITDKPADNTTSTGTNAGTNNTANENSQSSLTPDYLTEFYKKFDKKYNYDPAKGRFNIWL